MPLGLTDAQALPILRARAPALHDLLSRLPKAQHRLAMLACFPDIEAKNSLEVPLMEPSITVQALRALRPFTSLTHLCFRPWVQVDDVWPCFQVVESLPKLVCLDLSDTHHMSAMHCKALAKTLRTLSQLQSLTLKSCGLSQEGCSVLFPSFTALKRLRSLSLENNSLTGKAVKDFCECFRAISRLTSLNLSDTHLGSEAVTSLLWSLQQLQHLQLLNLSGASTSSEAMLPLVRVCERIAGISIVRISNLLPCTHGLVDPRFKGSFIEHKESGNGALDVLLGGFTQKLYCPDLRIFVSAVPRVYSSAQHTVLQSLSPATHVRKLVLLVNALGKQGPAYAGLLGLLPKLTHLEVVVLEEAVSGDELAPIIAAMTHLSHLSTLIWIQNQSKSSAYAERFSEPLRSLTSLQQLTLSIAGQYESETQPQRAKHAKQKRAIRKQSQERAQHVDCLGSSISFLTQLTFLWFSFCTPALLSGLAPALPGASLKELCLDFPSDATSSKRPFVDGLRAFADNTSRLQSLQTLNLTLHACGDADADVLAQALPHCQALKYLRVVSQSFPKQARAPAAGPDCSVTKSTAAKLASVISAISTLSTLHLEVHFWSQSFVDTLLCNKSCGLSHLTCDVCDFRKRDVRMAPHGSFINGNILPRALCSATRLQKLVLRNCMLSSADVHALDALTSLPCLEKFCLRDVRMSPSTSQALGALLSRVSIPCLSNVRIEVQTDSYGRNPNGGLEEARMDSEKICSIIQNLPKLPCLQKLYLAAGDMPWLQWNTWSKTPLDQGMSEEYKEPAERFAGFILSTLQSTFRLRVRFCSASSCFHLDSCLGTSA